MWPFKSKFEKIKREDVNDAINQLDAESKKIDTESLDLEKQMNSIKILAKKEKVKEIKLNYIKKYSYIKRRRVELAKRSSYILYNIELMEKLKRAIDDNQMFKTTNGLSLNKLLKDQNGLRKFLLKSLNIKQKSEQTLTQSNEIFENVNDLYEENEDIYGKNASDDELLAAFEKEEGISDDVSIDDVPDMEEGEISDTKGEK